MKRLFFAATLLLATAPAALCNDMDQYYRNPNDMGPAPPIPSSAPEPYDYSAPFRNSAPQEPRQAHCFTTYNGNMAYTNCW